CLIETRVVPSIYHVPLHFHRENLDELIVKLLHIDTKAPDLDEWERMIQRMTAIQEAVRIAVVGKYVQIQDAYKSIIEAFTHAGVQNDVHVSIVWVDAGDGEKLGAEEGRRG